MGDCKASLDNTPDGAYEVIAQPSEVIHHHEKFIEIEGVRVMLTLVTMKRSFLLVIGNSGVDILPQHSQDPQLERERMIRGFMRSNSTLSGLSLALGEHNTCMIESNSSLASATLASRLSKKLNKNRPVYVANNFQCASNVIDTETLTTKLYLKIFQFVQSKYVCEE